MARTVLIIPSRLYFENSLSMIELSTTSSPNNEGDIDESAPISSVKSTLKVQTMTNAATTPNAKPST